MEDANEYRLGLDIGTASVGAVALSLQFDELGQSTPLEILWHRAHIFSEPLENKQGTLTPKAQDRRLARQRRRQLERRKGVMTRIKLLAPLLGLDITAISAINTHIRLDNGTKVHKLAWLRAKAAEQRIELHELVTIFLRLAKRRGYSGGFKPKSAEKKPGAVETGAGLLAEQLKEQTLGQYLLQRLQQGLPTRLKIHDFYDEQADLYALREHVEQEFSTLWDEQAKHHDILNGEAVHPVSGEKQTLKKIFHQAIFYQRPLKPVDDKVGQCPLETNLPRAPKAHMAAQAFRIEKLLGDLRFGQRQHEQPLSRQQKDVIRSLLNQQAEVKFEKIYTALEKNGCPLPAGRRFSIDRAHKETIKGNTTLAGFRALKLLDEWSALDPKTQTQVINLWSELGSPEQLYEKDWQLKFVTRATRNKPAHEQKFRQFSAELVAFMNLLAANKGFDRLSKTKHFEGGRAAYSIKALEKLTQTILEFDCDENHAIRGNNEKSIPATYPLFQKSSKEKTPLKRLPQPERTGNAVVDVALRQIGAVVNDCIDNLGKPPREIIVELSRDIKNGVKARNEMEKNNNKQAKNKQRIRDDLEKEGAAPTPSNVLKYELWEEQDHQCPYCDRKIGVAEVASGAATNFEHIIPRSKSKVGRKRSEILLAHRDCNADKTNQLPMIAFADKPERLAAIEAMAKRFEKKKLTRKAQLLRLDDDQGLEDDKSVSGFADWQHQDTSWIGKLATQWLTCLTEKPSDVSVTRGGLTAYLRRNLGLETVIPEVRIDNKQRIFTADDKKELAPETFQQYKAYYEGHRWHQNDGAFPPRLDKRIDHRHHIIDALAIALSSRSFVQQATRAYQRSIEKLKRQGEKITSAKISLMMRDSTGGLLENFKVRDKAMEMIRSAHITHKPDRWIDGKFYQDQAYRRVYDDQTDKLRLITTKPLRSMAKDNAKDTIKALEKIISTDVREHVIEVYEQRIADGTEPKKALNQTIFKRWYGQEKQPIVNVKVWYDMSAEKAVAVPEQSPCKYLIPEYYAYMSVFLDEQGKVDKSRSGPVTLAQALRYGKEKKTGEIRFYKGDTVVDKRTMQRLLIQIMKASGGGTLFMAPLTETRNIDHIKSGEGKRAVSLGKLIDYEPEV